MKRVRALAAWLAILASLQLVLYLWWSLYNDMDLFYFDPRIGLFAVMDFVGVRSETPLAPQWLSALWLALLSGAMWFKPAALRVYLITEFVLALPSLLFFGLVFLVNMSPAHGFSRRELVLPVIVFLAFTVAPLLAAIRLYRRGVASVEQQSAAV